ncbi:MAG: FtsQ-type POTRA domain-containing protein [Anaerolineaceae bacterium]|nr:FtsQ-type POTRA domain-containing protein [Anaerolineaceae bacterium]
MSLTNRRQSNRATQVRTRRSSTTEQRAAQAVDRVKNPTSTPPVMTRGRVTGMAAVPGTRKRQKSSVRRKYYYTLNTTGAEVRLPAIPQIQLGWRLLSGVLSIAFLIGIWAMWSSAMFQVDKVRVVGAKRIPTADINTTAGLEGLSILEADPAELTNALQQAFPDLASVSVQVGLPADVVVRVTERTPILAWQQGSDTKWIDQAGFAFPVRGSEPGLVTIQAEGNPPGLATNPGGAQIATDASSTVTSGAPKVDAQPKPFISPEMIDPILKMSKQVPEGTPVLYDPRYGLGWSDPTQGWKVYIGMDLENMDLKLNQYRVIVDDLNKRGIRPVMISVEFPHAPFYRLE